MFITKNRNLYLGKEYDKRNAARKRMLTEKEWHRIIGVIHNLKRMGVRVLLKTCMGPDETRRSLERGLTNRGIHISNPIHFWCANLPFGALEFESEGGHKLQFLWVLGERNELLDVTPTDDLDLSFIIDSLASGHISSGVLRTLSLSRFPDG